MLAAASSLSSLTAQSAVYQGAALPSAYQRPALRPRQRLLEWDRDETAEARRTAAAEGECVESAKAVHRALPSGPRRMGEFMPAILARYGLEL